MMLRLNCEGIEKAYVLDRENIKCLAFSEPLVKYMIQSYSNELILVLLLKLCIMIVSIHFLQYEDLKVFILIHRVQVLLNLEQ